MRESTFYGKALYVTMAASVAVNPLTARVFILKANSSGLAATLTDARYLRTGAPVAILVNDGANAIAIKSTGGTTLFTLAVGTSAHLALFSNATAAGTWKWLTRTTGASTTAIALTVATVSGGNPSNATYAWNETAWSTGTATPNAHIEAAVMPIGPSGFFVGSDAGGANNDELQGGAWVGRTAIPIGVGRHCGAFADDRGFIFGGDGTSRVYGYSPDAWVTRTAMSINMSRGTAQGFQATPIPSPFRAFALIVPGSPVPLSPQQYLAPLDVFTSLTTSPSSGRYGLCSFAIDHLMHVVGGKYDTGPTYYADCDEFNPLTGAWTVKTALTSGARHRACGVAGNRRGLVMGGKNSSEAAQSTAAAFFANSWTALSAMPAAKSEVANNGVSL